MRENRPYGSEGGESGSTGLPYPYRFGSGRFAVPGRSHLSPDGAGLTRAAPPLGSGWLRFAADRQTTWRLSPRFFQARDC